MELRIATCRPLPEVDPDEDLLLAALAERGVSARMAAWNDPKERWSAGSATVLRSTWDYIHRLEDFLEWAERASAAGPFWNPLEIVRGNVHKRYLLELARRGVATTPTVMFERSARVELARELDARRWSDVVIKPAVGAGSFGARRFAREEIDGASEHLHSLLADRDALVQPYLPSVETHGERALVWIDGRFTHAVRKTPRWSGGDESVSDALAVEPDERELGELALAPLASQLLYARVDVARDERGAPLLMELELIEPSLFLKQHPLALSRFVDAVARRLADARIE
ncbi:MAG: hypothetical protein K8S98_01810 [Planctomycetes bacterium]|nr:hypothetical protein [Planctomycetota bacterium]